MTPPEGTPAVSFGPTFMPSYIPRSDWSWWPVLLGVTLSLPCLWFGFAQDDFLHRLWLEGRPVGFHRSPWELYEFVSGDESLRAFKEQGFLPWWASDDLKIRFFRPLASLSLAIDYWLFGQRPFPAHVHSLLWLAALLRLAVSFLERLLPKAQSQLAAYVYCVSVVHALPGAWLASRHVLVAGVFAVWALLALDRDLNRRRHSVIPSLASFLALMTSEIGVSVLPLLAALVWYRRGPWTTLLGPLALGVGYLFGYWVLGFGAGGAAGYLGISNGASHLAVELSKRLIALLAALLGPIPANLYPVVGVTPFFVALCLWIVLYGARVSGLPGDEKRRAVALWRLFVGAGLAMLPGALGFLGGRSLVLPALIVSAAIAILLSPTSKSPVPFRVAGAMLFVMHLGVAPLLRIALTIDIVRSGAPLAAAARSFENPCRNGQTPWVLGNHDPSLAMYGGAAVLLLADNPPARWVHPFMIPPPVTLRTRHDGKYEVQFSSAAFESPFERLFLRPGEAPQVGDTARVTGIELAVLSDDPWTFELTPGEKGMCFLRWGDSGFVPVEVPPIGQEREIVFVTGPMGLE